MMEATEHGDGYYAPGPLHGPAERGIFSRREVRAGRIVVGRIGGQDPAKTGFTQHHDMVEALPDGTGQPLSMAVLPWRARGGRSVPNPQGSQPIGDDSAIGTISIAD